MKVTIGNSTFLMLNMLVVYKKGKPNTFFLLPRNGIYSLTQCNPFPIYVIFVHTQSSLVPPPHHTEPNVNPGHQCSVSPGLPKSLWPIEKKTKWRSIAIGFHLIIVDHLKIKWQIQTWVVETLKNQMKTNWRSNINQIYFHNYLLI